MTRNKKKNRDPNQPSLCKTTEKWAKTLLDQFCASGNETYVFEEHLSNSERGTIHQMCRRMGLGSKSHGSGDERRLTIKKKDEKESSQAKVKYVSENGIGTKKSDKVKLKCVSFPPEVKPVLHELFTRYPPCEGDTTGTALGIYTGTVQKRDKDEFFLKPEMTERVIRKKVAILSSRVENDNRLREIFEARSKLPITSFRDAIISAVESNQVVLIAGETGCGKTTQVPQYLLDHMWGSKREACKIICTQPRRISAISVSERIAWERGENIGFTVGYKVRLQSEGGKRSSVVFCTNGILLRVLIGKGANSCVSEITHIIVDEIHERDCYSDFMLAILRDLLPSNPHIRLILMSATLDAERFSGYFGGCPVVRVPGFTYPVKIFFLEDVLSVLQSDKRNHVLSAKSNKPGGKRDLKDEEKVVLDEAINLAWTNDDFKALSDLVFSGGHEVYNYQESMTGLTPLMVFAGKGKVSYVCKLLSFGRTDCSLKSKEGITALELAEKENKYETAQILSEYTGNIGSNSQQAQDVLVNYVATGKTDEVDVGLLVKLMKKICSDSEVGAILVFLPGWEEIRKTNEKLSATPFFAESAEFRILCLHSKVPAAEQKKVFIRPPQGCRKIVLATNIAESAVTIDDVVYVIDSGRMKEKSYDPYNDLSTLQSSWVSKANAKQREGRAGRCQPGICYHLYSKLRAASLPEYRVPEVRRMPVDELCLQVKMLDPSCNVNEFLQKLMDPPVDQSIANALAILKDIGALTPQEELTELGQKFGQLPVHPRISKMLYFAVLVNCLDPALILACAADTKDPFIMPMLPGERQKAAAAKKELTSLYGDHSDHLAIIAAFMCWKSAKERGQAKNFCSKYFISPFAMCMLDSLRRKLQGELRRHGFISSGPNYSLNAHDPGILRAVVAVGFYPMVGRMCPLSKNNTRSLVETITGTKVRVLSLSNNVNMSSSKYNEALIVFDEITRGDWDVHIRSCTLLPAIPLLLFSREIAVSPTESYAADESNDEQDVMDIDKTGERHGEKIMLAPENSVKVVVDRWLSYKVTAFEIAQMYILRERLMASILFKVKHPNKDLPPHLGASMYAIACILSYDGLTQPSGQTVAVKPVSSVVDASSIRDDITSTNSNGEHENTTSMGSKLESANKLGLDNREEEHPDPNTVPMQSSSKKFKSVDNVDLENIEENKPSDLSNIGNEQISPKSASNLEMGDIKENKPSDLADGNEQTESVHNMDLEMIINNMPSGMANSTEQTEPDIALMEAAAVAKQPKKGLSRSKKRKLANNMDSKNMNEDAPADLGNVNEQMEPKTVINLDLRNMEENKPFDLSNNGNEHILPKSASNLDMGDIKENIPSDLADGNDQTESESVNNMDLEMIKNNMPAGMANSNEQTEPDIAPMEAASVAKQPKKRPSRSKKRKLANTVDSKNMNEDAPADLGNGNEQMEPKTVINLDLRNMEENKPSDLSNNGNEPILPKSASNLDMGDKKENIPSDLADGNEQTESESVHNLDLEMIKNNMPAGMANSNEQTEPDIAPMEAASVAKQPKKRLSRSKKRKLANNMDSKNMNEDAPADLGNGNEQMEPKTVINLDLRNMEENKPSDLSNNGNEHILPKSASNLDMGDIKENIPSDLADGNEQTESESVHNMDLEMIKNNMPSGMANSNEQTEPDIAPMEAASGAKQPEKRLSRSKKRKLANTVDSKNMNEDAPADLNNRNEQTEPQTVINLDLGNTEENKPSDLSNNGNEHVLPKSASNLDMEDIKENRPSNLADGNEQTESESVNNMDLEIKNNMPSDMASWNEQTEPKTAPMEPSAVTKQPKKRLSRSKRRKLANSVDLKNMEEDTPAEMANENEQTEPQNVINLDLGNTEENKPSDLTTEDERTESKSSNKLDLENMDTKMADRINGNEQTESNATPVGAASAVKQPKRKLSRSKRRLSTNNLDLGIMEENTSSDLPDVNELKPPNESDYGNMEESLPSNLAKRDEQPNPNPAPMETVSVAKQPEKKRSRSKRRRSVNNLNLETMEDKKPSDVTNGNEQPDPNPAPEEVASVSKKQKKRSKKRKLANNIDLGKNMEENMPSSNGIELPDLNSALTEAPSMAKRDGNDVQTKPQS